MRDFADGKLPEAEYGLSALIPEEEAPEDPWRAVEMVLCLQDRATVRRFSNRCREALNDLARCESMTMSLGPLHRRMMLPNVYYVRALLLGTSTSDVYSPAGAVEALAQFRELSGAGWVADSIEAEIAFHLKEWGKAAALYRSVARCLEGEGWMQGAAGSRSRAAEALIGLRDWTGAEGEVSRSLVFLEASGPPDMLANARLNLARIRSACGRPDDAWELALGALEALELVVRYFRDVDEQQGFLGDKLRFYAHAFEIARSKAGDEGQWRAWSIAERAKSFYLCQLVANADVDLFEGADAGGVARLSELESRLDEAERRYLSLSPQEKAGPTGRESEQQVRHLSREKRELLGALMKQNPRWGALKAPLPFDMRCELTKLDSSWVVLSYFWLPSANDATATLHLFWSGADRKPQTVAVPWTAQELDELDNLRRRLRGRVWPDKTILPRSLAAKLLPPQFLSSLAQESQLLISPHDRVKALPLQAAPIGPQELLIDRVPVQFIPTLALLPLLFKAEPAEKVLLMGCPVNNFGDKPLQEVDAEIASIARIWRARRPGKVVEHLIPPAGSPKDAGLDIKHWNEYGILHLACHGVFEEGRPFDAALRLGSDAVRASELFSVRCSGASVFLSACSLGRQQDRAARPSGNDEWIGFYLPLFYAGARYLLLSLYEADSRTAMEVMTEVHTLLCNGLAISRAYQAAIKAAIGRRRPAALWANWCLVGPVWHPT